MCFAQAFMRDRVQRTNPALVPNQVRSWVLDGTEHATEGGHQPGKLRDPRPDGRGRDVAGHLFRPPFSAEPRTAGNPLVDGGAIHRPAVGFHLLARSSIVSSSRRIAMLTSVIFSVKRLSHPHVHFSLALHAGHLS